MPRSKPRTSLFDKQLAASLCFQTFHTQLERESMTFKMVTFVIDLIFALEYP